MFLHKMSYNDYMTPEELYELIEDNPGISEDEIRQIMRQPELFYDDKTGDELDKLLADCERLGLNLIEDGDCLWIDGEDLIN